MEYQTRQPGLKRNWDYIKTSIIIQIKGINEYKLNLYYGLFFATIFSLVSLVFLFLINENFSIFLNWGKNEYLFFVLFGGFNAMVLGGFSWGSRLNWSLLSGELNNFISKPVNIFLQYLVATTILFVSFPAIIYFLLVLYFAFFILDSFSLFKLIVVFIFGFFGSLLFLVIYRFFDSVAFFMKSNIFLLQLYASPHGVFAHYPSIMFEGSKYGYVMLLFANTYYASYATEFFFGHIGYEKLLFLSTILIFLNLFFLIGIWIMWHYGLKKYEAFG